MQFSEKTSVNYLVIETFKNLVYSYFYSLKIEFLKRRVTFVPVVPFFRHDNPLDAFYCQVWKRDLVLLHLSNSPIIVLF